MREVDLGSSTQAGDKDLLEAPCRAWRVTRIDHNKDITFILLHDATDQMSLMPCEAIDVPGSDCESSC